MEKYKYHGSSVAGRGAGRVILEGSVSDPKRFVDVGHEIELSEDEVTSLRKKGLNFRKAGESDTPTGSGGQSVASDEAQQQADQNTSGEAAGDKTSDSAAGKPRGAK